MVPFRSFRPFLVSAIRVLLGYSVSKSALRYYACCPAECPAELFFFLSVRSTVVEYLDSRAMKYRRGIFA